MDEAQLARLLERAPALYEENRQALLAMRPHARVEPMPDISGATGAMWLSRDDHRMVWVITYGEGGVILHDGGVDRPGLETLIGEGPQSLLHRTQAPVGGIRCVPKEAGARQLQDQYGEEPVERGIAADRQSVFEWWRNGDTGTWTILKRMPNGMVCMMADGHGWHVPDSHPGSGV